VNAIDLLLYVEHLVLWIALGLTRVILGSRDARTTPSSEQVEPLSRESLADHPRALLSFHMLAFAVMYFGMANAVFPGHVSTWFRGQRIVGSIVMLSSGVLGVWALVSFRSWRVLAKIERGHQLATHGPFRILRHPIYMAMNLLALGTAFWVPTIIVWAAVVLMTIGSDVRARAEETLLERAFGASYRQYRVRTWRFVPGVY